MNNTRTDGAANIFGYLRHHTVYVSHSGSIETVNISTNNFDAEQGLAGGAAITAVTKSGANDLHGSFFEFHDNQRREHFRGRAGRPIVRNKLFYFGSWESTRERLGFSSL